MGSWKITHHGTNLTEVLFRRPTEGSARVLIFDMKGAFVSNPDVSQFSQEPETVPECFYWREGEGKTESFVSTILTRGPWNRNFQHGGPPSALLTTALMTGVDDMALARVTLEFLRPVPIDRLRIEVQEVTEGRSVRRRSARLFHGEKPVMEATGLFIRQLPTETDNSCESWPQPEGLEPFTIPFFPWDVGYQSSLELRLLDPPWGKSKMRLWGKARFPLVAGRETLPEAHVMILADAESGLGPPVDPTKWTYVNPDLTVYFGRPPEEGWLGLEIHSFVGELGGGISEAQLRDDKGIFGRSLQNLLVEKRPD